MSRAAVYQGQKPLTPEVHPALGAWVRRGGTLVFADDDSHPYLKVREWWNTHPLHFATPRTHLFESLGWVAPASTSSVETQDIGQGHVTFIRENPVRFANSAEGHDRYLPLIRAAAGQAGIPWQETNHFILRRGPYLIAAGLKDSIVAPAPVLTGRFINLFDPALRLQTRLEVQPDARFFLIDLNAVKLPADPAKPHLLASACRALPQPQPGPAAWRIEGIAETPAIVLLSSPRPPARITLDGEPLETFTYDSTEKLLHLHFPNTSAPRTLTVEL